MRNLLLQWYTINQRKLPWRDSQDPFAIWVSEIMLQQTQVATVVPYFIKFMKRFPNLKSLALAQEEEVLSLWSGLGYYRRAKFLKKGAEEVLKNHAGRLPQSTQELKTLPGIGDYTAGAIASIAFGEKTPVVDGNVIRVLSRVYALKGHAKKSQLIKKIWQKASLLVQGPQPGDLNQALMELGATLCRPSLPSCERCPIMNHCKAYQKDKPEEYPEPPPKQKTIQLKRAVALCFAKVPQDSLLLVQKKSPRWFQGLWELPHEYLSPEEDAAIILQNSLKDHFNLKAHDLEPAGKSQHSITHHRIESQGHRINISGTLRLSAAYAQARFFSLQKLTDQALPNLERKVLKSAGLLDK